MSVVTRIAPSPTGDPHVGTAYVGLFNYAFAKRHGGRFILRLEDTDRQRYQEGTEARILSMLEWLGLTPDEGPGLGGEHGPYRQSERLPLYKAHAEELIARGKAYRAFETGTTLLRSSNDPFSTKPMAAVGTDPTSTRSARRQSSPRRASAETRPITAPRAARTTSWRRYTSTARSVPVLVAMSTQRGRPSPQPKW
jgi:glutamyl/glutaminyl-tRNA synthetase